MKNLSQDAEPCRTYQNRKATVDRLAATLKETPEASTQAMDLLWRAIVEFEDYPFITAKGLEFRYSVRRHDGIPGNEMFVNRKEKSITRSSVEVAFKKALELGRVVSGPKKLGVFGASYLYPVFIKIGVIREDA